MAEQKYSMWGPPDVPEVPIDSENAQGVQEGLSDVPPVYPQLPPQGQSGRFLSCLTYMQKHEELVMLEGQVVPFADGCQRFEHHVRWHQMHLPTYDGWPQPKVEPGGDEEASADERQWHWSTSTLAVLDADGVYGFSGKDKKVEPLTLAEADSWYRRLEPKYRRDLADLLPKLFIEIVKPAKPEDYFYHAYDMVSGRMLRLWELPDWHIRDVPLTDDQLKFAASTICDELCGGTLYVGSYGVRSTQHDNLKVKVSMAEMTSDWKFRWAEVPYTEKDLMAYIGRLSAKAVQNLTGKQYAGGSVFLRT